MLKKNNLKLFQYKATTISFIILTQDITLIDETQLKVHALVDLVIVRWPCQSLSMVRNKNEL